MSKTVEKQKTTLGADRRMSLSGRIERMEASKSAGLHARVTRLKNEGQDIIGLHVGELEFPTPAPIISATVKALQEGHTRYGSVAGLIALRERIALRLSERWPQQVHPNNISVANGAKQCIYNVWQTLCSPGDEVIVPIPYWVTFPESIKLAGATPVTVPCTAQHQLDIDRIEKTITPRSKAIVINSPNNPSGAVYPRSDLQALLALARRHDIYIVSDEAYETIVYDGATATSPAALASESDAFDRVITVRSFSKSHCMTGFRIGYTVASTAFVRAMNALQSHLTGNNCTFAQYGALAAVESDGKEQRKMLQRLERRRDIAVERAAEWCDVEKPQGAFYLWANIENHLERFGSDVEMAEFLLQKARVALLPGSAFGDPRYIRLSFSVGEQELQRAFDRIKKALA